MQGTMYVTCEEHETISNTRPESDQGLHNCSCLSNANLWAARVLGDTAVKYSSSGLERNKPCWFLVHCGGKGGSEGRHLSKPPKKLLQNRITHSYSLSIVSEWGEVGMMQILACKCLPSESDNVSPHTFTLTGPLA